MCWMARNRCPALCSKCIGWLIIDALLMEFVIEDAYERTIGCLCAIASLHKQLTELKLVDGEHDLDEVYFSEVSQIGLCYDR